MSQDHVTTLELRRLNFYRASELHGGLLLAGLARRARDPHLVLDLTRHGAEEIAHAALWTEAILALGGEPRPTRDTYQARYARELGPLTGLVQVLALTQVFERRVSQHFTYHGRLPGTSPLVKGILRRMVEEEKSHLSWVRSWLDRQAADGRDVGGLMARFKAIDESVYRRLFEEFGFEQVTDAVASW
jgi:hypothetical protein